MNSKSEKYGTFSDRANPNESLLTSEMREANEEVATARVVHVNAPIRNSNQDFPSNVVKTTRYTRWTFVPKNLFEQFHRLANVYFLFIIIIELIPGVAPIFPITSILPLLLVLTVSAVKEGYEDYQRGKEDKKVNRSYARILKGTSLHGATQQDIVVGDIIYIGQGEEVPADCVVLSTSDSEGVCYVETMNLDGETSLSPRQAPPHTLSYITPETLFALRGRVECPVPSSGLNEFDGRLYVTIQEPGEVRAHETDPIPLSAENMLLRGFTLRNTEFVYGFVFATGPDTKLALNSREAPSKMSHLERQLNRLMIMVFVFLLFLCLFSASMAVGWRVEQGEKAHYLHFVTGWDRSVLFFLSDLLTFIALLNQMIPISLYVTAEIVKVAGAWYVRNDIEMYDIASGRAAEAHTSSIQEDLGQVQYVFSDKTGTLTRNEMVFKRCTVKSGRYCLEGQLLPGETTLSSKVIESKEDLVELFEIMALCNTVFLASKTESGQRYQASSPDELALVEASAELGISLESRAHEMITLSVDGKKKQYELLHLNAFSSERKRMSVVVRTPEGKIKLLVKGADSVMLPLMSEDQKEALKETESSIHDYSVQGYRTLVLGSRELSSETFNKWFENAREAETAIVGRAEKLEQVALDIETGLDMVGVTAVEDRLQEGVPESIDSLLEAGIKVWVLTGDKLETAVNIGYSCSLLQPEMKIITISRGQSKSPLTESAVARQIDNALTEIGNVTVKCALIIDGEALDIALSTLARKLYSLGNGCHSVLCCRMSPIQKAQVVRLVKDQGSPLKEKKTSLSSEEKSAATEAGYQVPTPLSKMKKISFKKWLRPPKPQNLILAKSGPVTLAIGDGANDVSMIQEADIGVGIMGKEGSQATMASDYALAQFRFLNRLLFVHGRYSYHRICLLVLYSLYKNATFVLSNFYFSFSSAFSGQTIYDSYLMMMFNVVYTSLPILAISLLDRDLGPRTLMRFPSLYSRGRKNKGFNLSTFLYWDLSTIWHSLCIYYGAIWVHGLNGVMLGNGKNLGLWGVGTIALTICIIVVTLKAALETSSWTYLNYIGVSLSVIMYAGLLWPYNAIYVMEPNNMYGVWWQVLKSASVYLCLVIVPVIALLPDFLSKTVYRMWYPADWMLAQEKEKAEPGEQLSDTLKDNRL